MEILGIKWKLIACINYRFFTIAIIDENCEVGSRNLRLVVGRFVIIDFRFDLYSGCHVGQLNY